MPYPKPFTPIVNPIDLLSYSSFYVETFFNDTKLSNATAFAYQKEDKIFLVSNRHVFSGTNNKPDSAGIYQAISMGAIPNKLRVWIYGWNNTTTLIGVGYYFDFQLIDDNNEPLYLSKKMGNNEYIDVAMLDISEFIFKLPGNKSYLGIPFCVNTIMTESFYSNYILHPSDTVYIIGYPFGKLVSDYTPIWKKGSIASDLQTSNFHFYVDTASKSGMSGSPIYRILNNNISFLKKSDGTILKNEPAYKVEFIGIYSGRIIKGPNDINNDICTKITVDKNNLSILAQLGIAWKKDVIDFILK